jgi:hypothetical protein
LRNENETCQTKHKRSKNNQWRGKNQWNIEWLVRLFIDLHLDAFLLQNSKRSTKVMHQYSKFIKMLVLADPEEGGLGDGTSFFSLSKTEKLRISVSKIWLKSVIFYSGPPFWVEPPSLLKLSGSALE